MQLSSAKPRYIAVIGPTASGKSALALQLAEALGGELVNCDSVQFYRGFRIGSAQPSAEEMLRVPHHIWNILESYEDFDARLFAERAEAAIAEIRSRGRVPILVGGTGLYFRALWRENWHDLPKSDALRAELAELSSLEIHERLRGLDPDRAASLHANDRFRLTRALEINLLTGKPMSSLPVQAGLRHEALVISMQLARDTLHQRIAQRTKAMLESGLIEEVEGLLERGVQASSKPMQSIGYASVLEYLDGKLNRDQLEEAIITASRQYAKRQETWFRKVIADLSWTADSTMDSLVLSLKRAFGG